MRDAQTKAPPGPSSTRPGVVRIEWRPTNYSWLALRTSVGVFLGAIVKLTLLVVLLAARDFCSTVSPLLQIHSALHDRSV